MQEKIENRYPNRYGTKINIWCTYNNKTPRFMHADQTRYNSYISHNG